jgi:hypothetical protein
VKPDANLDLALNAALALARSGNAADLPAIVAAADSAAHTKELRLRQDRLRVFHVAFSRHGKPDAATVARLGKESAGRIPSGDNALDRLLAQLAIYLGEPTAPARVLQAMKIAQPSPAVVADPEILAAIRATPRPPPTPWPSRLRRRASASPSTSAALPSAGRRSCGSSSSASSTSSPWRRAATR